MLLSKHRLFPHAAGRRTLRTCSSYLLGTMSTRNIAMIANPHDVDISAANSPRRTPSAARRGPTQGGFRHRLPGVSLRLHAPCRHYHPSRESHHHRPLPPPPPPPATAARYRPVTVPSLRRRPATAAGQFHKRLGRSGSGWAGFGPGSVVSGAGPGGFITYRHSPAAGVESGPGCRTDRPDAITGARVQVPRDPRSPSGTNPLTTARCSNGGHCCNSWHKILSLA